MYNTLEAKGTRADGLQNSARCKYQTRERSSEKNGVPFLITKSYGQRAQSLQCMVDLSFYYLLFGIDYAPPFNWLQSVVR